MWVYILAFNFVPLIYTCVFLSILCFFLIVMALYYTLKLGCVTFRFLLFSQDCFVFSESFVELYRRQWHPTPVFLPGESHGRRSLEGCSPWDRCGLDTTEQLHFHFPLSCIGEGNGNPLQCSCLENPRDGGAWWAAVYGVAQS